MPFATTTMLAIGFGLAAGGTAVNAIGQVKAGKAAEKVAKEEASRLEYNAGVADLQAKDALQRGQIEESQFRSEVRGVIGAQRAGFASSGVDVNSGSARDVAVDARRLGEADALQIRKNAEREAFGFRAEAEDLRRSAKVARLGGQAQKSAAYWGAAGSVLGGGGSLLMARYGWSDQPKRRAA